MSSNPNQARPCRRLQDRGTPHPISSPINLGITSFRSLFSAPGFCFLKALHDAATYEIDQFLILSSICETIEFLDGNRFADDDSDSGWIQKPAFSSQSLEPTGDADGINRQFGSPQHCDESGFEFTNFTGFRTCPFGENSDQIPMMHPSNGFTQAGGTRRFPVNRHDIGVSQNPADDRDSK